MVLGRLDGVLQIPANLVVITDQEEADHMAFKGEQDANTQPDAGFPKWIVEFFQAQPDRLLAAGKEVSQEIVGLFRLYLLLGGEPLEASIKGRLIIVDHFFISRSRWRLASWAFV